MNLNLPKSKFARALLAIVAGIALIFGGVGIASAVTSSSAAAPSNLYGCVTGPNRTLEHVYTVEQNFLNAGTCASTVGGFPVTVNSATGPVTPTPTPTTPTPTPTQTTPTPTPTPTTPTPTPTQPAGTTFSESCAAKTSTSASGCGGIDLGPSSGQAPGFAAGQASRPNLIDVQPDGWSGSQGPASVSGSSYQNWTATETDTPPQANSAQILTYPSTTFNYYQLGTPVPAAYDLNNITSLTSSYSEQMPPVADKYTAENAYDIWLNNWDTEVMIWTDVHYQTVDCGGPGWTPQCSGSKLLGNFTYNGQSWSLYDNGGGINGFYMWIPNNGEALDAVSQGGGTGTVDLKAMLAQTAASGGFTADSPLTQIGYGWEVADTGGKPLPFKMNSISVSLAG